MRYLLNRRNTIFFIFSFFIKSTIQAQTFTLQAIKAYPYPTELTASAQGTKIAWAFDEEGKRNVYVAEGPAYTPRKLTNYINDDAQEITSLSISGDGKWVVYVRGGDHGSNWNRDVPVNTTFSAIPPKVQIWSVPFAGGEPKAIAEADEPVISPKSDSVVFIKGGQVWVAPVNASSTGKNLFTSSGTTGSLKWSPNGTRLAFVSNRGDHSMIGVYTMNSATITWIAPSFKRDNNPKWSPDGTQLVFIRNAGGGGAPDSILVRRHQPWSIMTADVASGKATEIWKAPQTLQGSIPTTHGGYNLHWAARNRIVFLSYMDGWPHIYSIAASGGLPRPDEPRQNESLGLAFGRALLLTPGNFMAEHIKLSGDGQWIVFAANTGPDKLDIDRRHVVRVPVDKPEMEVLTPGAGLEWYPVVTGDGSAIAMISATAQRPPLPAVLSLDKKDSKLIALDRLPTIYPQDQLVTPKQVIFKSADGAMVHAQLFEPAGGSSKKPAIIYVHGGPPRQMLLGWHYSDYYANAYATNQYLANQGFVVLSVNYRLGIGYGFKFHQPERGGRLGASEYQDVRAAAVWLGAQPFVDKSRIGIYGGSYGGYLTALALSRDSKLFAAGVDIHGVHDWTNMLRTPPPVAGYEKVPDLDSATRIAYIASPVATVKKWTSPVLIIHGDDDRNVQFSQSTDLVKRLEKKGVTVETLVIVDDTHHWMKHSNALTVDSAIADFFVRKLMKTF
ncbi:MAG: prolyl oligopeptidase family serine peptidase [Chitinophagaceae bacterium]